MVSSGVSYKKSKLLVAPYVFRYVDEVHEGSQQRRGRLDALEFLLPRVREDHRGAIQDGVFVGDVLPQPGQLKVLDVFVFLQLVVRTEFLC